ncbi:MAG: hypothetical protein HQ567_26855 [Candidatus Nealsonbacteria bacterium]|nr:hypothetical protein [Candidatus Nealsonbacteria bacterium]
MHNKPVLNANACRYLVIAVLLPGLPTAVMADESRVERYADGAKKYLYSVDVDGKRHGDFNAFYPDGMRKGQARYVHGKLFGPIKGYHASGRIKLRATYREGLRTGKCQEFAEDGSPTKTSNYRDGKLHGAVQQFDGGRVVKDEIWLDGRLLIPRSPALISAELAAIAKMPVETVGDVPQVSAAIQAALRDPVKHRQREAALRVLMSYRFLCGVPYRDLALDHNYNAAAEATVQILSRLGRLTHTPENPGLPPTDYEFARDGAASCNIYRGGSMVGSVKCYMDDSDPTNIERLGHRRWCLNPAMQKTGFSGAKQFAAMWSMDGSRAKVPDYEFVAFPPPGLIPTSTFGSRYAWSVSLNPAKYEPPTLKAVGVQIWPAQLDLRAGTMQKAPQALKLDYFGVSETNHGIGNCIIFRPEDVNISANTGYWVEITGLKDTHGKAAKIEYFAGFFRL